MIKHPNNMLQHLENIIIHGALLRGVCGMIKGEAAKKAPRSRSKPRRGKRRSK